MVTVMNSSTNITRLKEEIGESYLADESTCVQELLESITIDPLDLQKIELSARGLVESVRSNKSSCGTVEAFIREYSLSSEEGIILMCLAEALLRIPDDATADRLIKDKLAFAEFESHLGHSHSIFVNASTWGLMLTGKLVNVGESRKISDVFKKMVGRMGEPVVRKVLRQAMKMMASQYVMGKNIDSAIIRAEKEFNQNYRFSFDMLGESALSTSDASRYLAAYKNAIERISVAIKQKTNLDPIAAPSISIKLSALHPRYEVAQRVRVMNELVPALLSLMQFACERNVAVTLDAEEADRLELSLAIFEQIISHVSLKNWNGLGLAVQAYQKRAMPTLRWLSSLAKKLDKQIPLRLVKGAYWDTEIKRSQEQGLSEYPVFTRKSSTDVSYIACAMYLLEHVDCFYPQFATHNAHTLATICKLADGNSAFEFQRLHGMGENLHDQLIGDYPSRIYSPVGSYEDLLPYLVRRLLENGANSSFVNRIENENVPIASIIKSPMEVLLLIDELPNPAIPLPKNIFRDRKNSPGVNLGEQVVLDKLELDIASFKTRCWSFEENDKKDKENVNLRKVRNPADINHIVGVIKDTSESELKTSLDLVSVSQNFWQNTTVEHRISIIQSFSKQLQKNCTELYALCVYEAGKTIRDAVSEIREAIDFCEYYCVQAQKIFSQPLKLPGPVGEDNSLSYHGRGPFICISPWNFPVAIFIGQIVAALISGNTVIAKASGNTSIVSRRIIDFLYESGLPRNVLDLVSCNGALIDRIVLSDDRVSGVAFTGSFETALKINSSLAARRCPIVPLIAETGGLNAMIVDSSALPEQVVKDVISSSFLSAGQRCSSLRILIVQSEVFDKIKNLLISAMGELKIGDPAHLSSDIPPVINAGAMESLNEYKQDFKDQNKFLHELIVPKEIKDQGYYVSPTLLKIESLAELKEEKFGPILHIMPFQGDELDELIEDVNQMGFGLTLGIHSRIDETIKKISNNVNVGNIYVNRNMVGAVVGVQPFGGEGYSGTGPKAGGPNYLQRFCTEKTITTNTSAIGGNADLLSMSEL